MVLKLVKILSIISSLLLLTLGSTRADQQDFEFGYVFNGWDSNSLFHGSEHRIPLTYNYITPDFSLKLNTAFVSGDYQEDAAPAQGIAAYDYNSSQFSDTTLGINWGLDMGNSVKSTFVGTLNIPTGDSRWEIAQEPGSIPYIFEPTYYHGRGWGGDLFYTLTASDPGAAYGLGIGYMSTSTYDTGLSAENTFSPGDTVVALGTVGFKMSPSDTWGFRLAQTFPIESTYADPADDFTVGECTILTTRWTSNMGKDKLVINLSYSFYGTPSSASPNPPYSLTQDPGIYFGDRLELHPILGYWAGKDTMMESGLVWDWIMPNGYSFGDTSFEGGGNLLGAEQSITFQLDPSTFWSFAGLYHFISNDKAGIGQTTINYERYTLGTNVGFKW